MASSPTKAQISEQLRETRDRADQLASSNQLLQESLTQVQAMLSREDVGWLSLSSTMEEDGLGLDDLKDWSHQIKVAMIANPHMKRGLSLRASYVWKDGIKYRGIEAPKKGRKNIQNLIDLPINQRNFFSPAARRRRETCLFSDGLYLVFGHNTKKTLEVIPIREITAVVRNPDRFSEIWAYRREYDRFDPKTGKHEPVKEWVYVDFVPAADRVDSLIPEGGNTAEAVNKDLTAFDLIANGIEGYTFGAPDALAALVWSRIVRDLTMDGVTMSHALAAFAFKATTKTRTGADAANLKLASTQTPGQTATVGGASDLVPFSSAGKGYDFDSFRAVIAITAAALDVSVIALTADPGTAGSSYGSASTLDLPTRLAMESRRDEHVGFDPRILHWMGAPDAEAYFTPFDDATETLRQLQALMLKWTMGLWEAKEMKALIEGVDEDSVTVPVGVLLPNNEKSLARRDIDPDETGPSSSTSTSAPGQGQSTKAGRGAGSNDLRSDQVANADIARAIALLERMIELEEDRLRAANR